MATIARNIRALSRNSYLMSVAARPMLVSINKFHSNLQQKPNRNPFLISQVIL